MAKVRFNLQTDNGRTVIRLVRRYYDGKFVYGTGIEVKRSEWNSRAMQLRKGATNWKEVNDSLDRLAQETERVLLESLGSTPFKKAELKIHLDKFWKGKDLSRQEAKRAVLVTEYAQKYKESRLARSEIKEGTARAVAALIFAINKFNPDATLEDIDINFCNAFKEFLISINFAPNTISRRIQTLKQLMDNAFDMGDTKNIAFKSRAFSAKSQEVDNVYLTAEEVESIERLELSGKLAKLSKARDLFLLGIYTGLRFSDFSTLSPEHFVIHEGVLIAKKKMQKTGKPVAVPIGAKALAILQKYGMRSPGVKAYALNLNIKEICRLAGIDEAVRIERTRGNKTETISTPKWTLVSTHTARRTFATLEYIAAVRAGRSYDQIMDITGHVQRATFLKYVKVGVMQKAVEFVNAKGKDSHK